MQRWVKWNAAGEVLDEYADTIVLNFNTIECNTGLTDVNGEWIFEKERLKELRQKSLSERLESATQFVLNESIRNSILSQGKEMERKKEQNKTTHRRFIY